MKAYSGAHIGDSFLAGHRNIRSKKTVVTMQTSVNYPWILKPNPIIKWMISLHVQPLLNSSLERLLVAEYIS